MKQRSQVFKEIIVELRSTLGESISNEELMRLSHQLVANAIDAFSLADDFDIDIDGYLDEQDVEQQGLYGAPLDLAYANEWAVLQFENQQGNGEVNEESEGSEFDRYNKIQNIKLRRDGDW
jgi:hypothetical protein